MNSHILQMEEEGKNINVFVQVHRIKYENVWSFWSQVLCSKRQYSISHSDMNRIQQMKEWIAVEKFPLLPKWKKSYKCFSWLFYMGS